MFNTCMIFSNLPCQKWRDFVQIFGFVSLINLCRDIPQMVCQLTNILNVWIANRYFTVINKASIVCSSIYWRTFRSSGQRGRDSSHRVLFGTVRKGRPSLLITLYSHDTWLDGINAVFSMHVTKWHPLHIETHACFVRRCSAIQTSVKHSSVDTDNTLLCLREWHSVSFINRWMLLCCILFVKCFPVHIRCIILVYCVWNGPASVN